MFARGFIVGFCLVLGVLGSASLEAQINTRSDGSDGAFTPVAGVGDGETIGSEWVVTVDLRNAVSDIWSHPITAGELAAGSATYGRGVYDRDRWVIVFKYSEVNIPAGVRVRFINHPSRAPVMWLVDGDCTIDGVVDLDGEDWVLAPALAEPGPGGFRGGAGRVDVLTRASAGFGPGGGRIATAGSGYYGGSHGGQGWGDSPTYGNSSLIPLVGGSGGCGDDGNNHLAGGGAGGGAILIAARDELSLGGTITARGGDPESSNWWSGSGAGGAVRLISDALSGDGVIDTRGGSPTSYPGGYGRIRLERNTYSGTLVFEPVSQGFTVTVTPQSTPQYFLIGDGGTFDAPQVDGPRVRLVSVTPLSDPAQAIDVVAEDIDPKSSFAGEPADIVLPETSQIEVLVETHNVEVASTVRVRLGRRVGDRTVVDAAHDATMDDPAFPSRRFWRATVDVSLGYSAIQVHVIRP